MKAYDIDIVKGDFDPSDGHSGWCFGLPPGIKPQQWPLDPSNGLPLAHGFTLILPDDYLCHGREIRAFSFFGPSFDINEGGVRRIPEIERIFLESMAEPLDEEHSFFYTSKLNEHCRLFRMKDTLGCNYALILLTEGELYAEWCHPPKPVMGRFADAVDKPAWLHDGSALALMRSGWHDDVFENIETPPLGDLTFHLGIRLLPREGDPNAGLAPCSEQALVQTGYKHCSTNVSADDSAWHNKWCEQEQWLHLGGTARPTIHTVEMSPCYMEFEQYLGGFNFGFGTMQLDIKNKICNIVR